MDDDHHTQTGRILRCDSCGERVGLIWGKQPDPSVLISRCYACAAVEEAENITKGAAER